MIHKNQKFRFLIVSMFIKREVSDIVVSQRKGALIKIIIQRIRVKFCFQKINAIEKESKTPAFAGNLHSAFKICVTFFELTAVATSLNSITQNIAVVRSVFKSIFTDLNSKIIVADPEEVHNEVVVYITFAQHTVLGICDKLHQPSAIMSATRSHMLLKKNGSVVNR